MSNVANMPRIYRTSSIPVILRSARERAVNPNIRTKTALAASLGITYNRLSRMEDGLAEIPLELAYEWCLSVGDRVSWKMILHIYGAGLPATDPRLLESLADQLNDYIEQAQEGILAAEHLKQISKSRRPGMDFTETQTVEIIRLAKQIRDTDQASENVLDSLSINWGVRIDEVDRLWVQKAVANRVVPPTVQHMDEIKREAIGV